MAGYPFSGKSYIANLIQQQFSNTQIISAKDYRPDDFWDLGHDERREIDIAAWECSLDSLSDCINKISNENIIIYDTSCASYERMIDYFIKAKQRHTVLYVFVSTKSNICMERALDKWIGDDVLIRYKTNFKFSAPRLSKIAHKSIIVNNDEEPLVSGLYDTIKKVIALNDNV